MYGMFKSENIVVINGTAHCKLGKDNKIVFQLNLQKFRVTFMRNKELHYLLNSRRTNSLNISLFVVFIILIMQYVAWQR
jgi:hypothetical protein